MVSRRIFIKSGCAACLGLSGASLLNACATRLPMVKLSPDAGRVLTVPETSFVEGVEMLVVRTNTLENDILLRKVGERYLALYLHCTHEGVGLTPTAERIYCHAHGSVFDLEGQVVKEPAFEPLKTFKTEFNNHQILIYLT